MGFLRGVATVARSCPGNLDHRTTLFCSLVRKAVLLLVSEFEGLVDNTVRTQLDLRLSLPIPSRCGGQQWGRNSAVGKCNNGSTE